MTAAATGPVDMGLGSTGASALCPGTLTVGLTGQTSSAWASTTVTTAATAIKTDSDGYEFKLSMTSNHNTFNVLANADNYLGGCLSGAGGDATNAVVCFYGQAKETSTSPANAGAGGSVTLGLSACVPYYLPVKNWVTTAVVTGAVAITKAKWYMLIEGLDCSATMVAAAAASPCVGTALNLADTVVLTTKWFQPKEISTKKYTTLPRFSAKETATWIGITVDGKKGASGCTGKALQGASALVAGAAVAVGAAALAF